MGRRQVMGAAAIAAAVVVLAGCKPIEPKESKYPSEWEQSQSNRTTKNGATATSVQKVVIVQQGDTLYGIAQRECGSGAAVDALTAANLGRLQPDGSVLTDPNLLKPGYEVVVSCQTVSR